jgi:hypothetical protein
MHFAFVIRSVFALAAVALALCASAARLSAQAIRGEVVESETGVPVSAAFVMLLDSAGSRHASVLTRGDGAYVVRAPRPGRFHLQVDRLGHQSMVSPEFELAVGQTLVYRFEVRADPISLEAITVAGEERCRISREAGLETQRVWDEARKALAITAWLESHGSLPHQVVVYERLRDIASNVLLDVEPNVRRVRSGLSRIPFASVGADALAAEGYVVALPGGEFLYQGLDAETLLSDRFLDTHCFRIRRGRGVQADRIGLEFEPLPGQSGPDVAGVLWLDRRTAELRTLEYRYTQHLHTGDIPVEPFGGTVDFARQPGGAWIVSRWSIRMPQYVEAAQHTPSVRMAGRPVVTAYDRRLAARRAGLVVREEGGEVAYIATPAAGRGVGVIEGVVHDSTRSMPLAGATVFLTTTQVSTRTDAGGRFRLTGVPAGEHEVAFFHAYTDSIGVTLTPRRVTVGDAPVAVALAVPASALCTSEPGAPPGATVIGFAERIGTGEAAAGVDVTVTWQARVPRTLRDVLRGTARERYSEKVTTDAHGRFVLCHLPPGRTFELRAGRGPVVLVEIEDGVLVKRDLLTR